LKQTGSKQFRKSMAEHIITKLVIRGVHLGYEPSMMGAKKGYLGFDDGVYCFADKTLLCGEKARELYITKSVGYTFQEVQETTDEIMTAVLRFVEKILPDEKVREWLMIRLNKCMQGILEKIILFLHGEKANNGKTQLIDGLMGEVLGGYWMKCPSGLLNPATFNNPNNANEEVASLKNVVMAIFSEPDKNKKLSMSLLKELTGGDKISARKLRKSKDVFKLTVLLVIMCNDIPPLDSADKGSFNRVRCVPFNTRFVTDKKEVDEANHVYLADLHINENFKRWRPAMMKYLLTFDYNVDTPEAVLEHTKKYQEKEDILAQFVADQVEKVEFEVLTEFNKERFTVSRADLWCRWKIWKASAQEHDTMRLSEFNEKIIDKLDNWKEDTHIDNVKVKKRWLGYRLKELDEDEYD